MDWANENYARLYVRDTKTWMLLGWEGQCVLALMLRKLDRAGVLAGVFDGEDLALIFANGMPVEIVAAGLSRLLKREVVELSDCGLVMPNYIEAQEVAMTDQQRKREQRERHRARSRFVTKASRNVTDSGRNVPFESRDVKDVENPTVLVTLNSPSLLPTRSDLNPEVGSKDLTATQRDSATLPPPPPSVTRVRSEARPANAGAQPEQGQPNAPQPAHSEPSRPIPPSEPKCVPLATRRVRATDDLMSCPVGELAKRCRLNQHDAAFAPLGDRPELVRVNEAWARAVGLQVRPLGSYGDRNRPLTALLEAFEVATEEELLRACEAAARDDWCCGRKGSDRDQARKRDIGCLSQTVLRRLLDSAAEMRPTNINPRVAAMLAEEERRRSGT